jgi:glycerol-3-phosphate dehydrogenase (NAD(P)+)
MKVTILGTGAYGLALSKILVENKNEVVMWTTFESEKNELLETKKSSKLDSFILDDSITITTDLEESIKDSKLIVIAIPTAFVTDVCKKLKKYIKSNQYICIASKGIEQDTCLFIHDIIKKQIKTKNIGAISGPSFAVDLVKKVPVGLAVASKSKRTLNIIRDAFCNDHFKLYPTNDIIGIEVCGAVKNIIAIASGMIDGMGYPISTQALLITQSLHDIKTLIYLLTKFITIAVGIIHSIFELIGIINAVNPIITNSALLSNSSIMSQKSVYISFGSTTFFHLSHFLF